MKYVKLGNTGMDVSAYLSGHDEFRKAWYRRITFFRGQRRTRTARKFSNVR